MKLFLSQKADELLPQGEEFKYFGVLLTVTVTSAVLRTLYWSFVVKREHSIDTKLSIHYLCPYLHLWSRAVSSDQKNAIADCSGRIWLSAKVSWTFPLQMTELLTLSIGTVGPLLLRTKRHQLKWFRHLTSFPPGWGDLGISYQEAPPKVDPQLSRLHLKPDPVMPQVTWRRWCSTCGRTGLLCLAPRLNKRHKMNRLSDTRVYYEHLGVLLYLLLTMDF